MLSPSSNLTLAPPNPTPRPTFEGVARRGPFARDAKDLASAALLARGAARVDSRKFRT